MRKSVVRVDVQAFADVPSYAGLQRLIARLHEVAQITDISKIRADLIRRTSERRQVEFQAGICGAARKLHATIGDVVNFKDGTARNLLLHAKAPVHGVAIPQVGIEGIYIGSRRWGAHWKRVRQRITYVVKGSRRLAKGGSARGNAKRQIYEVDVVALLIVPRQ